DIGILARGAFDEGDFAKAASYYDQLIAQGTANGHLFYNAGLAYYRLGEQGKALAAFLAARSLLPRDPDVRANIASVLAEIENKLDATQPKTLVETVVFWIPVMTLRELVIVSSVLAALVGLFLWATLVLPRLAPLRVYAFGSLLLPVL